jgi:RNA polymerase sigma factor (sigma-70 family)
MGDTLPPSVSLRCAILTEAIRSLRGGERLVVTCYYYEELSTEEVAFLLNRTASSVHQIYASAISQLLTKLQL